jgi:hypothetical protein
MHASAHDSGDHHALYVRGDCLIWFVVSIWTDEGTVNPKLPFAFAKPIRIERREAKQEAVLDALGRYSVPGVRTSRWPSIPETNLGGLG